MMILAPIKIIEDSIFLRKMASKSILHLKTNVEKSDWFFNQIFAKNWTSKINELTTSVLYNV